MLPEFPGPAGQRPRHHSRRLRRQRRCSRPPRRPRRSASPGTCTSRPARRNPLPFHSHVRERARLLHREPDPRRRPGHRARAHLAVPRRPARRACPAAGGARRRRSPTGCSSASRRPRARATASATLDRRRSDLAVMRSLSELYRAYVGTELIFDDTEARRLQAAIPAEAADDLGFDRDEDRLERLPAARALPGDHRADAGVLRGAAASGRPPPIRRRCPSATTSWRSSTSRAPSSTRTSCCSTSG